jgi:hypothetical protein
VADELSRFPLLDGDRDLGLRGGRVTFAPGPGLLNVRLRGVRWVRGATIDGTATFGRRTGQAVARLVVHLARAPAVRLTARWRPFGSQRQPAVITGSQAQRRLAATCPAP